MFVDDDSRMRPDAIARRGAAEWQLSWRGGNTSTPSSIPCPAIADLADSRKPLAPRRRVLRVGDVLRGSPLGPSRLERSLLARRQPTKWLFTLVGPVPASSPWPRRCPPGFRLVPSYLRSDETRISWTTARGRRFRALKLWAVIRCYGRYGLEERIREHVRLARLFASWVEAEPGWDVVAPVPFSAVCFRREGSDEENLAINERANATGAVFLSPTVLRDRTVLRLAIGNLRTTEADVERAWVVLRDAAAAGSGARRSRRPFSPRFNHWLEAWLPAPRR